MKERYIELISNGFLKNLKISKGFKLCTLLSTLALMQFTVWQTFKLLDIRVVNSFYVELLVTLVLSLSIVGIRYKKDDGNVRKKAQLLTVFLITVESGIFLVYNFTLTFYLLGVFSWVCFTYYNLTKMLNASISKQVATRRLVN